MPDYEKVVERTLKALEGASPDPEGKVFKPNEAIHAPRNEVPQIPDKKVSRGHSWTAYRHGVLQRRAEVAEDPHGIRLNSDLAHLNSRLAEAYAPDEPEGPAPDFVPPEPQEKNK